MEPDSSNNNNNIYVFHQGSGAITPKDTFLFVFPCTERLTLDVMTQHAMAAMRKKSKNNLEWSNKATLSWIDDSVLKRSVEQSGSSRAIMVSFPHFEYIGLLIEPFTKESTRWMIGFNYANTEKKVDELIKHYETLSAITLAVKRDALLASKNIYYYDERKVLGGYAFDKRSPEGKEFINAKLIVKREKLLAQRARSANDRRRDQRIDVRRQAMLEN